MAVVIDGIIFESAIEAGLGPEHFAGVEERWQEAMSEADKYSDESMLIAVNKARKECGESLINLEEYKRIYQ